MKNSARLDLFFKWENSLSLQIYAPMFVDGFSASSCVMEFSKLDFINKNSFSDFVR